MVTKSKWRDLLVMVVFALAAIGLAFAGYARVRAGQDWHTIQTTPRR